MVRRIVTALLVLAACVAAVVLTAATDESRGKTYKAAFDNAFGLTEGGDLRIGGVNAGQTTGFSLTETEPTKAVVEFTISEPGFDSLREDARCEVRQQSLIGEYYVDCQPGTSEQELPAGGTIPVEQTASIIPADLVNNVLRRPYRERLRLIVAELGTGLAGRPEDLAATIERAHPGLRETVATLDILKGQTQVLRDFIRDSDAVIDDLAQNRADVARFVREAGETAEISATRKAELAEQFEKLPRFLAELDPTMVRLGQLADAQVPLLADLRTASGDLERFFTELGPFAQASRPALRSLGDTSVVGIEAIRESSNEIRELRRVAAGAGEVGEPLRQFLQTADSRARAVETDKRAKFTDPPGFDRESLAHRRNANLRAEGFSGFEALLNYVFWQTLGINSFDGVSHFLRILGIVDETSAGCTPINVDPDRPTFARCNSHIGPTQPGIDVASGVIRGKDFGPVDPDPTAGDRAALHSARAGASASAAGTASAQGRSAQGGGETSTGAKGEQPSGPVGGLPPELEKLLDGLTGGAREGAGRAGDAAKTGGRELREQRDATGASAPGGASQDGVSSGMLLDFLLGP